MMNTYYSHAGAPYGPLVATANHIVEATKDGWRNTFLFWEPGTRRGVRAGHGSRVEAQNRADRAARKAGKPAGVLRFGRRSFSGLLK